MNSPRSTSQSNGRVLERLQSAFRDGGVARVATEIHRGGLFKIYNRLADPDLLKAEAAQAAAVTELADLTIQCDNSQFGVEITSTPYVVLFWVFASLRVAYESWNFLDIGSGRGRFVLAASRKPFKV